MDLRQIFFPQETRYTKQCIERRPIDFSGAMKVKLAAVPDGWIIVNNKALRDVL